MTITVTNRELRPGTRIEAFKGEFSGEWVGVRYYNGRYAHSVQRASREAALSAAEEQFTARGVAFNAPRFEHHE